MVSPSGDENASQPAQRSEQERPRPAMVLVRYGAMNAIGEFSRKASHRFAPGARVVVQTERGIELGQYLHELGEDNGEQCLARRVQTYVENSGPEFCRFRAGRVLRQATTDDCADQEHLNAHIDEDIRFCAERAAALGLELKVVTAEHLLGGERIVFYFGAPGRIDFRQLVKELASRYRTRIEMRQVGARDEARLVADHEVCGRECCCKNFLKKLRQVNMKMAKLQKSTLDPSKVSGRCGRLRCCLRYEHLGYEELARRLPRGGSRVETGSGVGTVVDLQILTQLVSVRLDDDRLLTVPLEEIKAFDLPPAPPRPPPARIETKTPPEQREPGEDGRRPRRRGRRSRARPGEPRRDAEQRAESDDATSAGPGTPDETREQEERQSTPREAATPPAAPSEAPPADSSEPSSGRRRSSRRRRRRRRRPDGSSPDSGSGAEQLE